MNHFASKSYDFLVITALQEEFLAALKVLDEDFHSKQVTNENVGQCVSVRISGYENQELTGILARPNMMGRLEAAILTSFLLARYQFRIIGLCGVAGALSNVLLPENYP